MTKLLNLSKSSLGANLNSINCLQLFFFSISLFVGLFIYSTFNRIIPILRIVRPECDVIVTIKYI